MKILNYEERKEEWLAGRRGRITGSRLKDIIVKRGDGKKIGFYELIAERLGLPADDEDPMERGNRLEPEALERLEKATGKKFSTGKVLWTKDGNENIAVSPDGWIEAKVITVAAEIKCLGSARHIEAVITNKVPKDYHYQTLQYFIVNEKLETLYFCFYDPRLKYKDFHIIEVNRAEVQEEVKALIEYQEATLKEIEEITDRLSAF